MRAFTDVEQVDVLSGGCQVRRQVGDGEIDDRKLSCRVRGEREIVEIKLDENEHVFGCVAVLQADLLEQLAVFETGDVRRIYRPWNRWEAIKFSFDQNRIYLKSRV